MTVTGKIVGAEMCPGERTLIHVEVAGCHPIQMSGECVLTIGAPSVEEGPRPVCNDPACPTTIAHRGPCAPSPEATARPCPEGLIERLPNGDSYLHSAQCEGLCEFGCDGYFACGKCGAHWNGTPAAHPCQACSTCRGRGYVNVVADPARMTSGDRCPSCGGTGTKGGGKP